RTTKEESRSLVPRTRAASEPNDTIRPAAHHALRAARYDLVRFSRPREVSAKRQRPAPSERDLSTNVRSNAYSRRRRFVSCAGAAGTKDRAMSRAQRMNDCTVGVRVRLRSVTIATGGRTDRLIGSSLRPWSLP